MILVICAVRDSAVDAFMNPFFVPHVGAALRAFTDECRKAGTTFNAHPEHFELYELGTFDDATGTFVMKERRSVALATDLAQLG